MKKELKTIELDKLVPYPGNPRHNNQSAKIVAKSIEQFGYINPIVTDENFVVLAGNTRLKALKLLGRKSAEVLVVEGLTEEQKSGFVVVDNRAGEFSRWNMTALDRMINKGDYDTETLKEFGIQSVEEVKKKIEELILGEQGAKGAFEAERDAGNTEPRAE